MSDEEQEEKKGAAETTPAPAEESPEETAQLIMRAAGIQPKNAPPSQSPEEHLKQLDHHFKVMMDDVKKALGMADQGRERAEKVVQRVETFCQEKLPQLIVAALDRAGEQGVRACLSPLRNEVESLTSSLQKARSEVEKSFWWMLGMLVAGSLTAGIFGGSLVCYYLRSR